MEYNLFSCLTSGNEVLSNGEFSLGNFKFSVEDTIGIIIEFNQNLANIKVTKHGVFLKGSFSNKNNRYSRPFVSSYCTFGNKWKNSSESQI